MGGRFDFQPGMTKDWDDDVPRLHAAVSERLWAALRPGGLGPAVVGYAREGGDPVDDLTSGSAEVTSS